MIASGITGFREMTGSKELVSRGNLLRKETEAGSVVAPELLIIPGEILPSFPDIRQTSFQKRETTGQAPPKQHGKKW